MVDPGRRPTGTPHTRGERTSRISNDIVGLVSRYTGRGPTKIRVTIGTDFVLVVLQDTLTKGERNLVIAGQQDAVYTMRRTFHELMREEAIGIVEAELDRRVVSYLGDLDPDANCMALVFLLDALAETGQVEVAEP